MRYGYPSYYKEFCCIGTACEDTCCAGWEISLDKKAIDTYRRVPGPFGRRLRKNINFARGSFKMAGRRCPFLNAGNLCDIYSEIGETMLCKTCRVYPRHMEDYGNYREYMLSLSCPEAARLILRGKTEGKPAEFYVKRHGTDVSETYTDQRLLMALLCARQFLFRVLRHSKLSLAEKMAVTLIFGYDLQRRIARKEPKRCLQKAVRHLVKSWEKRVENGETDRLLAPFRDKKERQKKRISSWLYLISRLEPVVEDWKHTMASVNQALYSGKEIGSRAVKQESGPDGLDSIFKSREYVYENLLVYFLYTYFLGAVYDRDAFTKIKMAVVSCLVIRNMDAAHYEKHGVLSWENQIWNAHLYSRAVENSDYNLEILENMLAERPEFHLKEILTCIMNDKWIENSKENSKIVQIDKNTEL